MKFVIYCMACLESRGDLQSLAVGRMPSLDSGPTTLECENGHKFVVTPAAMNYEIVMNYAFIAFRQEFYREALIDAYAAYEALQKIVIQSYIFQPTAAGFSDEYNTRLKTVLKMSERRMGAYSLIYAINGIDPPILPNKYVELRNRCVHDGEYPSQEDAFGLLKATVILIRKVHNTDPISRYMKLYKDSLIGREIMKAHRGVDFVGPAILSKSVLSDENFVEVGKSEYDFFKIDSENLWDLVKEIEDLFFRPSVLKNRE